MATKTATKRAPAARSTAQASPATPVSPSGSSSTPGLIRSPGTATTGAATGSAGQPATAGAAEKSHSNEPRQTRKSKNPLPLPEALNWAGTSVPNVAHRRLTIGASPRSHA